MENFRRFSSIQQFSGVVKWVRDNCKYHGTPLPKLTFSGSVKLHGCFKSDTPVTLANGEQVHISEIVVGTYVNSYDLTQNEFVPQKVLKVLNNGVGKEWCKLIFDDREIICTKDHLFYTKNRGWIAANDLTEIDEFITE